MCLIFFYDELLADENQLFLFSKNRTAPSISNPS